MSGDPFEPFRAEPSRAAILTDFDGTLAPIVDDPAIAAPLPGAVDVLHRLAARYGLVGVVSGRPVSYLAGHVGEGVWLSGLYGLERIEGGRRLEAPEAGSWRPVVAEAVERAEAAFGAAVEPKGLSLTIHFRTRPELGPAVRVWADGEAARTGLVVRSAKASLELHPPVKADKGTVVEAAAAGMDAVCFLGDDVGDLPAYDALDRLRQAGVHTVKVGVSTLEAPAELLERADVVVDGPPGALALLESLL
ncbi:MAG: trehalose-phosphatase [Actinomycetia bacterium]|nr:trehalose-phosphatase [Actinomycetes bacterium]